MTGVGLQVEPMTVVVAFAGWEVVRFGVRFFLKRTVGTDYVTRSDCENCRTERGTAREELARELREVKGILLVVAVRSGIDADQLKELTR